MLNSNLNLSTLPECTFTYQIVNSELLFPCMEYQRLLHTEKVASIAENFSEYIANDPKSASGMDAITSLMGRTRWRRVGPATAARICPSDARFSSV